MTKAEQDEIKTMLQEALSKRRECPYTKDLTLLVKEVITRTELL